MSKPLKLFIKPSCLKQKTSEVIKNLNNANADEVKQYFNQNTTWIVPKFAVNKLSDSIFTEVDSDKSKTASSDEIYKYLQNKYGLSQKELSSMTVEETINAIDKYLKNHPDVST